MSWIRKGLALLGVLAVLACRPPVTLESKARPGLQVPGPSVFVVLSAPGGGDQAFLDDLAVHLARLAPKAGWSLRTHRVDPVDPAGDEAIKAGLAEAKADLVLVIEQTSSTRVDFRPFGGTFTLTLWRPGDPTVWWRATLGTEPRANNFNMRPLSGGEAAHLLLERWAADGIRPGPAPGTGPTGSGGG